jgi:hypothetical protein
MIEVTQVEEREGWYKKSHRRLRRKKKRNLHWRTTQAAAAEACNKKDINTHEKQKSRIQKSNIIWESFDMTTNISLRMRMSLLRR